MAADGRGWPWKLLWFNVRGNCRGTCRGLPWQLPRIGGLRWQWPRIAADGRGNCCGLTSAEITVAIAADFRGLRWLVPRSLPRTEPAMSRGPCRGHPRISTVARGNTHGSPRKCRGHCRGPPPKSQIMCIRASVRIVHPLRTPDLEVTGTSVERDYVGSGSRRASSLSLETGSSRSIVICWQSYNMTRYTRFRAALTDRWR